MGRIVACRKSILSLVVCAYLGTTCHALLQSRNGIPSLDTHVSLSPGSLSPCLLPTTTISQSSLGTAATSTRLYANTKSSSSATKRKRKKQKNGNKKVLRNNGPGRSLTQAEISDHVSSRYLDGRDAKHGGRGILNNESDQAKYLKELNRRPALVLNADYQPLSYLPLSLWSWQDAVKAIFGGKVVVVDVYPDITVRAANLEIPLPSVIALVDYVPHLNTRPAFTRRNVFLRDEYKCQYCNDHFHTADLSLDHVHPRCMGGQLNWENAVTSCLKCNGRKGSLQVSELRRVGMRLVRQPTCPSQMELAAKAARMVPRRVHPTWKPYLGIAEKPSGSGAKKGGDEEFIDDRYFEEPL